MKKTLILFTALSGAFSCLHAQTADDIINKYITAMGGLDKLNSIKSIYMEDSVNAGSMKIPVKIWQVNNKSMRVEFSLNGMTGFQIMRNDSGWAFAPFQGQKVPEPATADEVKKSQSDLNIAGSLINYKQKGYKVTYEGKDETEGSESYKVKVAISDSISETYFIDPDTYYIIQVKSKKTQNGKTSEDTETRSDYKKTPEGYVFPMETNSSSQGDIKTYVIKVNIPMDPKIFSPAVKVVGK